MEVEHCCDANIQIWTYLRFPVRLKTIVRSPSGRTIVVDTVEWVAHIEKIAVFGTGGINAIVIWHHIRTIEKTIPDSGTPFPDVRIYLKTSRKNIFSNELPVILCPLTPVQ